jgi:hypothetical protein
MSRSIFRTSRGRRHEQLPRGLNKGTPVLQPMRIRLFGCVISPRSRKPSASGRNLQPRQRCQVRARPRAVPAGPACPPAAAGGMRGAGPIFDIPSWYTISSGRVPEGSRGQLRPAAGPRSSRHPGPAGRMPPGGPAGRRPGRRLRVGYDSSFQVRRPDRRLPGTPPRPGHAAQTVPVLAARCPEPILVFLRTPGTAEDWPAAILSSTRQNGVSPNGSARPDHLHR